MYSKGQRKSCSGRKYQTWTYTLTPGSFLWWEFIWASRSRTNNRRCSVHLCCSWIFCIYSFPYIYTTVHSSTVPIIFAYFKHYKSCRVIVTVKDFPMHSSSIDIFFLPRGNIIWKVSSGHHSMWLQCFLASAPWILDIEVCCKKRGNTPNSSRNQCALLIGWNTLDFSENDKNLDASTASLCFFNLILIFKEIASPCHCFKHKPRVYDKPWRLHVRFQILSGLTV